MYIYIKVMKFLPTTLAEGRYRPQAMKLKDYMYFICWLNWLNYTVLFLYYPHTHPLTYASHDRAVL